MTDININRLSKRFHIPPGKTDWQQYMDATLNTMMAEHLEVALGQLGVSRHQHVCIRLVHLPLHFNINKSQSDLSIDWSQLFAQQILSVLATGGVDVLSFTSRINALIEFAVDVSHGNLQRSWAWNQLGLSHLTENASITDAREQLLNSLLQEATAILPTLIKLSRIHRLLLLLSEFSKENVGLLYKSMLHQAGVELSDVNTELMDTLASDNADIKTIINTNDLQKSTIFKHLQTSMTLGDQSLSLREWSVLIILEVEPMLLKRSSLVIASAVITTEEYLLLTISSKQNSANGNFDYAALTDTGKTGNSGAGDELLTMRGSAHLAQENYQATEQKNTQPVVDIIQEQVQLKEAVRAELSNLSVDSALVGDNLAEVSEDNIATDIHMPELEQDHMSYSVIESQSEGSIENEWIKQSKPIYTEYGGLFFLLPILGEPTVDSDKSIIDLLVNDAAFATRPLSWILYQLITQVLSIATSDPGLRVFCNIAIEDEWPWREGEGVSAEEEQAIRKFSKLLLANLKLRLPTSELNSVALLLNISQRSAAISIDTGWIELVFNMQDVDTDIRRSGLDLDPDYVPWLGKVVKFRYA